MEALHFEERKILYITQSSIRPPTFVSVHRPNSPLHFSHERYLMNQIRKRFGFEGTPIVVKTRARNAPKKRKRGLPLSCAEDVFAFTVVLGSEAMWFRLNDSTA